MKQLSRAFCIHTLFLCAVCIFAASRAVLAGSEADWFYQAAAIEARFEKISSAQVPWADKAKDYYALLDDVKKFDAGNVSQPPPAVMNREGRGRHAFSLLCTGWIQQMLADSESAEKTETEYKTFLTNMPEDERAIATGFFEKQYQKSAISAPPLCNVETDRNRPGRIRVTAQDWPLRDLLERMAAAGGEKITIPDEVSGLVDYRKGAHEWYGAQGCIFDLIRPLGLTLNPPIGTPLRVQVVDPLYSASLGERADRRSKGFSWVQPPDGIPTGYVIQFGYYVPPPYVVEIKGTGQKAQVCINSVALNAAYVASEQAAAPDGRSTKFGELIDLAIKKYAEVKAEAGKEEAARQVVETLKKDAAVRDATVIGTTLALTLNDGNDPIRIGLEPFVPKLTPGAGERMATNYRRSLENTASEIVQTLQSDGLVIIVDQNVMRCYKGAEGRAQLREICRSVQEVYRNQVNLCYTLFADTPVQQLESEVGWQVLLNLNMRALACRLEPHHAE